MFEDFKEFIWLAHQVKLPFRELPHGDDKAERIEAMGPYYQNGKIYHSAQMAEAFGLEDELQHFPKGADNVADAASMQREVAKPPKMVKKLAPPASMDEMIQKQLEDRFGGKSKIARVHPILGEY